MRLDVRFVAKVEPILIRQLIETTLLRIVSQPNGIDVVGLHQAEIFANGLFVQHVTVLFVVFVVVHPFDIDPLAVHIVLVSLHLRGAEPDACTGILHKMPLVLNLQHQIVEVGVFCTPAVHPLEGLLVLQGSATEPYRIAPIPVEFNLLI